MTEQKKAKINIPFCMGLVLLFLTLLSIHFTGGLYAKYTTSTTAEDQARVIKFGAVALEETADTVIIDGKEVLVITPGVNLKKDVRVSFEGSEADTFLFVEIEAPGWAQATEGGKNILYKDVNSKRILSCTVENSWTHLESDGSTHIFYKYVDTNTVVDQQKVLEDIGNSEKQINVNEETTKADLADIDGVNLIFKAVVVQANGFENATSAWLAVKNHS